MHWCLLAAIAALGFLADVGGQAPEPAAPWAQRWLSDFTQARAEARRTGKPIFAVFRCLH